MVNFGKNGAKSSLMMFHTTFVRKKSEMFLQMSISMSTPFLPHCVLDGVFGQRGVFGAKLFTVASDGYALTRTSFCHGASQFVGEKEHLCLGHDQENAALVDGLRRRLLVRVQLGR